MTLGRDTPLTRLKRHDERKIVVKERYQRPEIKDLGQKWKIYYWDYSSQPRRKRSKSWNKECVPTRRKAQQLADEMMSQVNARNNSPDAYPNLEETLASLFDRCHRTTWPLLKNSTRKSYGFFFKTYLLPRFGHVKLRKLRTVDLQEWFNTFHPRLAAKTIRNMHAALRSILNQAIVWEMLQRNPAMGVKLPRKKSRKAPIVLTLPQIRAMLEILPEPSKSIVTLSVFASMRVGEILALRWNRIAEDRISIIERVYDGEFDDVKTESGERDVPFDKLGLIAGALKGMWDRSKYHEAEDLIFANRSGKVLDTHNLLNRQIKPAARKLGLPSSIDFRSFRTMHASLMRRTGARPEITRDNMGHSEVDTTFNVYSETWWDERAEAVSKAVEAVFSVPAASPMLAETSPKKPKVWVPFWVPQTHSELS